MDAGLGGASRAFADIGTHWCDLVEWISGQRITEVSATVETVIPKRPVVSRQTFVPGSGDADSDWETVDTEDAACMVFRASGDIIGTLTVSQVAPGRKNRIWIEFDGPQGSLVFDEDRPDRLWFGTIGGNQEILREPAALSPDAQRVSTLPAGHHEGFLDAFAAFLGDVYGAVDGGPALYPDFTDGLRSVRITEAVLRSSAERAWVEVGA
jgi:predicted dehydrogenase